MKKNKEIPIGGVGIINGYRVTAKEYSYRDSCARCCFSVAAGYRHECPIKKCSGEYREDGKHVYFEKDEI